MVTNDPAFMLANSMRDTVQAWLISPVKMTLGAGAARGFRKAMQGSPELISILAGGGGTGGFYKNSSMRRTIESPAHRRTVLGTGADLYRWYRKVGFASEYMNRVAIFEAVKKGGGTNAEGAYQALDLMNFSGRGAWPLVQFLIKTVPFLNARLQGLYRLGRGVSRDPRALLTRGAMLTMATLGLYLLNKDDDRYNDLPPWDKDTYYHFFLENMGFSKESLDAAGIPEWLRHVRLPKSFDIGAFFSTIPERAAMLWAGTDRPKDTLDAVKRMILDTFAFNPLPQAIKPLFEQVADMNFFTGRSIVGMRFENLRPEAQYGPETSETARLIGQALPEWAGEARSPVRLEHLVRGYFGEVGMYILGVSDALVRGLVVEGEKPATRIDQIPVLQRFLRLDPPFTTKWVGEFYDLRREVEAIQGTFNKYRKEGDFEAAKALRAEKAAYLKLRPRLQDAYDHMRNLDRRIEHVKTSKTMSAARKRELVDKYTEQKLKVAKRYGSLRPE